MKMNICHTGLWASLTGRCLQALLLLCAVAYTPTAQADDVVSVEVTTALVPGQTGQLAVMLDNSSPCVAFQFDIALSEGLAVAKTGSKYAVELAPRAASHSLSTREQSDGSLRVAVTSLKNKELTGNSGAVLLIDVDVADDCPSEGTITLSNVRLTTTGVKELKLGEVTVPLHIGLLPGDVNLDGRVTIADVVMVVDHLLGHTADHFNAAAANADGVGGVTIADALAIVNIILGKDSTE